MRDVNENIERLIVRSLDGLLDEQGQLELNLELIRNPDARRMMDAYRAGDELAATALAEIAGTTTDVDRIVTAAIEGSGGVAGSRRFNRSWLLIPGAIAAAVLALVVPKPAFESVPDDGTAPIVSTSSPEPVSPGLGSERFSPGGQRGVGPLRTVKDRSLIQRRAGSEWIGVVGDDGNLYWIEVERSRTIRTPQPRRREGGGRLEM